MGIDSTAQVHKDARLEKGVQVGAFTIIEQDVEIGAGTRIHSHVRLCAGTRIGRDCEVFMGAVIAAKPQDLKFKGEYSTATIGDHTTIREYVTVSRGTGENGATRIGRHCLFMAYTHVGHDCVVGDRCIFGNLSQLGGHCRIEKWAIIGGMVAVHQFGWVGEHAIIAAGVTMRKDVPPYVSAGKDPLRYCGINATGLKRRAFEEERIEHIRHIYQYLYNKGLNRSDALVAIREELPDSEEKARIVSFVERSERGLIG